MSVVPVLAAFQLPKTWRSTSQKTMRHSQTTTQTTRVLFYTVLCIIHEKLYVLVEACLHPFSTAVYGRIAKEAEAYLRAVYSSPFVETYVKDIRNKMLHEHVKSMRICEVSDRSTDMPRLSEVAIQVHVYQLNDDEGDTFECEEGEENVQTIHTTLLPSVLFDGLWESLVYDEQLQYKVREHDSVVS